MTLVRGEWMLRALKTPRAAGGAWWEIHHQGPPIAHGRSSSLDGAFVAALQAICVLRKKGHDIPSFAPRRDETC